MLASQKRDIYGEEGLVKKQRVVDMPHTVYVTHCDPTDCCGECFFVHKSLHDLSEEFGADEIRVAVYELKQYKRAKLSLELTEW